MFDWRVLSVAVGLFVMYLLLSLIATTIQEMIANALNLRGRNLYNGIKALLGNDHLANALYNHAIIRRHYKGRHAKSDFRNNMPSYIAPEIFGIALLDILRKRPRLDSDFGEDKSTDALTKAECLPSAENLFTNARSIAEKIPPGQLQTNLTLLIADAEQTDKTKKNLEFWYNDAMNHNIGRYKRQAQCIALVIGLFISVGFNADTVSIAQGLWNNATRLNVLQLSAAELLGNGQRSPLSEQLDLDDVARMLGQLPLGWSQQSTGESVTQDCWTWPIAALGWLLTAFAISLGSGFWFDTLQKCLRATGPRIPSTEEAGNSINKKETPKRS